MLYLPVICENKSIFLKKNVQKNIETQKTQGLQVYRSNLDPELGGVDNRMFKVPCIRNFPS